LYERTSWVNCVAVRALPLIQLTGSGKPFAPVVAVAAAVVVQVSAESMAWSAATITAA
jgi:hypothetical protein